MEKVNIEQIGQLLLTNKSFIQKLRQTIMQQKTNTNTPSIDLERLIDEIRQLLHQLIQQQLQNQLKQIIEDNNKILKQVEYSVIKQNKEIKTHQFSEDISFNQVHRIMDEERKKMIINEDINDASLQKSISAFVQLKVQTIQEKVNTIDKRLKGMEDKYQSNLKSIWNVLSITQGAIFDHIKQFKNTRTNCKMPSVLEPQPEAQKKSIFDRFKFGK